MPDNRCSRCNRTKYNKGYLCPECQKDSHGDPTTHAIEDGSVAKLILMDAKRKHDAKPENREARNAQSRARGRAAVHTYQGAQTAARLHAVYEERLAEMGAYVTVEQHVVTVRDAVEQLVRAGGGKPDILRAIQDGVAAASEDVPTYFQGTSSVSHNSGGPREA